MDEQRTIRVDQFPSRPPGRVWQALTETWTLAPEGHGTWLFLEHDGLDRDDPNQQSARRIMGAGWRSTVMPPLTPSSMAPLNSHARAQPPAPGHQDQAI